MTGSSRPGRPTPAQLILTTRQSQLSLNLRTNCISGSLQVPTPIATSERFRNSGLGPLFHLDASHGIPGTLCHSNELELALGAWKELEEKKLKPREGKQLP